MEEILVSVVIPTYSRNDTLKRAIGSVLCQTYSNIEIIVVDDNPADSKWRKRTEEIMKEYTDSRIRYIQNEKNLGGGLTRNEGIKASKGSFVAFLDDDDEYLPERLEKQIKVFTDSDNEKLALVYCYAKFINGKGTSTYSDKRDFRGNCIFEAMAENCIAATSQWMVKREALIKVGCFPDVPCKQDSQTILRLLKEGYEVDVLKEELSLYYDVDHVISGAGKKNILGESLYRTECRKLYYLLEDWQIMKVEYKFAEQFYRYYKLNHMKEATSHEKKIMKMLDRKAYTLFMMKESYHWAKRVLKK